MDQTDEREIDRQLDAAIEAIRSEAVDPSTVQAARDRAWAHLAAARSEAAAARTNRRLASCADFQAMIPDYLSGALDRPHRMLLEDHVTACPGCRRRVHEARAGQVTRAPLQARPVAPERGPSGAALRRRWAPLWPRWKNRRLAPAAAVIVAVGLVAASAIGFLPFGPSPVLAEVSAVDGELYRVDGPRTVSLTAGEAVHAGQTLRTGRGGSALLALADGSSLELGDRAGVSLAQGWRETRVDLARGRMIVRAANELHRRLVVATPDLQAAVEGSVVAVDHGVQGSRVSVLVGQLHVDEDGRRGVLGPGDQMVSRPELQTVALGEEFDWSRDAATYAALTQELTRLGQDVSTLLMPGQRHSTRLLDLVPRDTALYMAMPNVGQALAASQDLLAERLAESDVLRSWWQKVVAPSGADTALTEVVDRIGPLSSALGDEIVVALGLSDSGAFDAPVVLAAAPDPAAVSSGLQRLLATPPGQSVPGAPILPLSPGGPAAGGEPNAAQAPPAAAVLDDAALASGHVPPAALYAWVGGGVLAASTEVATLQDVAARVGAAEAVGTATSADPAAVAFLARVRESYAAGVDWLFAVDLARAVHGALASGTAGQAERTQAQDTMSALGLLDAKQLVVTSQRDGGADQTTATVYFSPSRQGMAAWLAEPGPMGSLDYVAPDAALVGAAVIDQPSAVVSQLFRLGSILDDDLAADRPGGDSQEWRGVLDDVAATLGGEVAVAIDGPVVPQPAPKVIVEVDDPDGLQRVMARAVTLLDQVGRERGHGGTSLTETSLRGRTYYAIAQADSDSELDYVFDDGYAVFATSRATLERAIAYRSSGVSFSGAAELRDLLPGGAELHFSALLYERLGQVLDLSASILPGGLGLAPDVGQALGTGSGQASPSLAYAYAYPDRIVVAHTGGTTLSALGLLGLLGARQQLGVSGAGADSGDMRLQLGATPAQGRPGALAPAGGGQPAPQPLP